MKILFYLDSLNHVGGIERVVLQHADFLSEVSTVDILTKNSGSSFYDIPSRISIFSLGIKNEVSSAISKLLRILYILMQFVAVNKSLGRFRDKYDYYYVPYIRNLLELVSSGISPSKIVVTEHGSYYAYNSVYKMFKRLLYPKCLVVVSPTRHDAAIYKSQGANSVFIPNPIKQVSYANSSSRQNVVLNVGRLTNDKRQLLLLDIWKEVVKENPEWKLMIVGCGELENDITRRIISYSLGNSVSLLPPTKDLDSIYAQSSVFALTSIYEGFSLVLAEAMSAGLPCISFDVPSGPRELLANSINGFLINNNNVDQYIHALHQLMNSSDLRQSIGDQALQTASCFSEENVKHQWLKLFKSFNQFT